MKSKICRWWGKSTWGQVKSKKAEAKKVNDRNEKASIRRLTHWRLFYYKPISRVLSSLIIYLNVLPTRLERAAPWPIWTFIPSGFYKVQITLHSRELLPRVFTLIPTNRDGYFLLHFPSKNFCKYSALIFIRHGALRCPDFPHPSNDGRDKAVCNVVKVRDLFVVFFHQLLHFLPSKVWKDGAALGQRHFSCFFRNRNSYTIRWFGNTNCSAVTHTIMSW